MTENDKGTSVGEAEAAEAAPALPEQHDFYRMPAKFGHVPVAEEPLGWDPSQRFEKLYPRVELPMQVVERYEFGSPSLQPNQLFFGDNLHIMRSLPNESIDLIYIDPPFFSQRNYNVLFGDKNEMRSFEDIWEGGLNGYLVWLNARLYEMKRLLKPTGSLLLHLDRRAVHYARVELDRLFGYDRLVNELIWYFTGAGVPKDRFAQRHNTILWYSRGADWTFNADPLRTEYASATQERFSHHIGNVRKGGDYGEQQLNPLGKHPDDVLLVSIIAPSAHERIGYPTQKPEALLERLILGLSDEGDVVADFFSGGGTTAAVAQRLGRRWIASDISRVAVSITADRIASLIERQLETEKASDGPASIPGFHVNHWGIYEIENLAKMPEDEFRAFVLTAFEARPDSTESLIHGYKGKSPISVGSRDPESPVSKEDVAAFATAVLRSRGSGATATMIGWAFSEAARQAAELIAAQEKLALNFVKLRLLPLESPEFAAHISDKHERYVDLLSFVLPPSVRLKHEKIGERRYRFDASESIALNSGAKIVNAQWDFDYRDYFTSSPGMALRKTKKGEPDLTAEFEFADPGPQKIAVRVQDDLGGESIESTVVDVD